MSKENNFITVRIPRSHWNQIVSDYENMCGTHKDDIEILQDAWVVEDADDDLTAPEFDALMESAEPVEVEVDLRRNV